MLKLIIVIKFLIIFGVQGQENTACFTPKFERGTCINLKTCDPLLTILRVAARNREYLQFLKDSQCGRTSGRDILVCCPGVRANPPKMVDVTGQYPLPQYPECGLNSDTENRRVVGGYPADKGQFPWIAALGYSRNRTNPKWLCGGTLITKRHVLTAGHCVHRRNDLYIVRMGVLDLHSENENPVDVLVEEARIHEEYDSTRITNDIAILKLQSDVTFSDEPPVRPICMPTDPELRRNTFVKYTPFVAGWGSIYFNGPSSSTLQTIQLPVVSNERCAQAFVNFKTTVIDQRVICAGFAQGGKDTCQGDSGGPLMQPRVVDSNPIFYQIGVISYGFRCAEAGYPGVYTRVTEFIDWIQNKLY